MPAGVIFLPFFLSLAFSSNQGTQGTKDPCLRRRHLPARTTKPLAGYFKSSSLPQTAACRRRACGKVDCRLRLLLLGAVVAGSGPSGSLGRLSPAAIVALPASKKHSSHIDMPAVGARGREGEVRAPRGRRTATFTLGGTAVAGGRQRLALLLLGPAGLQSALELRARLDRLS